jgi:hypothetical protein
MLPSYASSAHREKMNRHSYGAGANGNHSSGRNNFSIATDKYDKYVAHHMFGRRWSGGLLAIGKEPC